MAARDLLSLRNVPQLLLAVTLGLAPFPLASVNAAWPPVWCGLLAVALAFLAVQPLKWEHAVRLLPVLMFAGVFGGAAWLQQQGHTLLGKGNPIWEQAQGLLGETVSPRISAQVGQLVPLGRPLAMVLVFCCAFLIALDRRGAALVLYVVAGSGLAYALYGFVALLTDPESILWIERPGYVGNLTSTFVNRNTAATYFGSCTIIWFVLMVDRLDKHLTAEGIGITEVARLLHEPSKRLVLALAGFVICFTATLMTASRAGTLLTVGVLLVAGGLFARRRLSAYLGFPMVVAVMLLVGFVFLEVWGGGVALRIGQQGLTDVARWEAYRSTLAIIADHPLLGTGHGTFADVFPPHRSGEVSTAGVWDLAHNSILELAAELGLIVAAAAVILWAMIGVFLLEGVFARRRDSLFPLTGLAVGLLGTVHSLVDFSLQIPGYGIIFAAVVGCGLAQSVSSRA